MRGLTVFLVLAGLALAAADVPVCPAPEDGGEAILFPNVDDCSTFWECDGYTPILLSCPGVLWFNPKENVCDYPVNIEEGVCTPPTEGPTEETTEGSTVEPTEPTEESTVEPTESTEGPTEESILLKKLMKKNHF